MDDRKEAGKNRKRVLVVGGSASGKSEWAEMTVGKWAETTGMSVVYVATAVPCDPEFQERVRRHQGRRPVNWGLIEVEHELPEIFLNKQHVSEILIVDSLGTWICNLMVAQDASEPVLDGKPEGSLHSHALFENRNGEAGPADQGKDIGESAVLGMIERMAEALQQYDGACVLVGDEVGAGIVPDNEMSRRFRDFNGALNQALARVVDEVYMVSCGLPLRLK